MMGFPIEKDSRPTEPAWASYPLLASAAFFMVACLCAIAIAGLTPFRAYALYNNVAPASKYSQSQSLRIGGDTIVGADIPDGAYSIEVASNSTMCQPTNCTLIAKGGKLFVTFTMTGAYTALYFGTADDAAAQTDDTGTKADAYYVGDPSEGYVPHEYAIEIPALNYAVDVATYTGGKDFEKGMWYSRQFSFNSSSEVEAAISGATSEPVSDDQTPAQSDGNSTSDNGSSNAASDGDASSTTDDSGNEAEESNNTENKDQIDDETNEENNDAAPVTSTKDGNASAGNSGGDGNDLGGAETGGNATASSSGSGNSNDSAKTGDSADSAKSEESGAAVNAAEKSEKGKIKARGIALAGASDAAEFDVSSISPLDASELPELDLTPYIVGVSLFVFFDLGLFGAFLLGMRRAKPRTRLL